MVLYSFLCCQIDAEPQNSACLNESLIMRHTNSQAFATNYLSEALKPDSFNFFSRASLESNELNAQYDINSDLINELKQIHDQVLLSSGQERLGANNSVGLTRSMSVSSVSSDLSFTSVTSSTERSKDSKSKSCSPEEPSDLKKSSPEAEEILFNSGETVNRRSRSRSPRALTTVELRRRLSLGAVADQSLGSPCKQLKQSRSCSSRIS